MKVKAAKYPSNAQLKKKCGWKEIPLGGIITRPSSALENKTGTWRAFRPVIDEKKCINCDQCVEAFSQIVRAEVCRCGSGSRAIERQRHRAAKRQKCRTPVIIHGGFVQRDPRRVLGIEQCIQVPSGHVGFTMKGAEGKSRFRPHLGTEKRNLVVVRVEDMLHRPAPQLDRCGDVRGVNIVDFCHATCPRVILDLIGCEDLPTRGKSFQQDSSKA